MESFNEVDVEAGVEVVAVVVVVVAIGCVGSVGDAAVVVVAVVVVLVVGLVRGDEAPLLLLLLPAPASAPPSFPSLSIAKSSEMEF